MKLGKHYTHHVITPESFRDGQWTYRTEDRDVILLVTYGLYAMVRRPHCMPYVCMLSDVFPVEKKKKSARL